MTRFRSCLETSRLPFQPELQTTLREAADSIPSPSYNKPRRDSFSVSPARPPIAQPTLCISNRRARIRLRLPLAELSFYTRPHFTYPLTTGRSVFGPEWRCRTRPVEGNENPEIHPASSLGLLSLSTKWERKRWLRHDLIQKGGGVLAPPTRRALPCSTALCSPGT